MINFRLGDIVLYRLGLNQEEFGAVIRRVEDGGALFDLRGFGAFARQHPQWPEGAVGLVVPYAHIKFAPTLFNTVHGWSIDAAYWPRHSLTQGTIRFADGQWMALGKFGVFELCESYEAARKAVERLCA